MCSADDGAGTEYRIRCAGPGDLEAVCAISASAYAAAYLPVLGDLPRPAVEDYLPRIALGQVWLLEYAPETGAVGVAVLENHADHLVVYSLAVLPERWGEGVGRRLLGLADERARAVGLSQLRLFTNARMTRNLHTYHRAGYRETGRRPHPGRQGEVLVDLAKRLDPPEAPNSSTESSQHVARHRSRPELR